MNRVILLIVTVTSLRVEGMAFGNEQYNLLDSSQVLYESRYIKLAFAQVGAWSVALLQEPIDLPTINDMLELPELSLRTQHLYAESDPLQEAEGAGSSLSKASDKMDKIKLNKKKPSENEFANLSFKQPNEYKPWRAPLGWSLVGLGGASFVSGVGCLIGWLLEHSSTNPDNNKITNLKISTIVLGSAGTVILITGVALLLWEEYAPIKTEVNVGPGYAGMSIKGAF